MPGLEFLLPFLVTAVLLSVTPGPGLLYVVAQTVARGRKAGWYSTLGGHLAGYIHVVAAAFGASLVLQAVPAAYLTLKVVGALYLFWLGARFLLFEDVDAAPHATHPARSHIRALKESFIVEATNPKSAVFFLALLPQFTDQAAAFPFWLQMVLLGALANVIFSIGECGCVYFADQVSSFLRSSRAAGRWMRRFAGSVMIALGAKLLVSER